MFDPNESNPTTPVPSSGEMRSKQAMSAIPQGIVAPDDIHTMPAKFLAAKATPNDNHLVLILAVSAVVLILGVSGFLVYQKFQGAATTNNANTANVVVNANVSSNANENTANTNSPVNATNGALDNTNTPAPTVLKQTVTDPDTSAILATATVTLPYGAVPNPDTTVNLISLSASVGAYATSKLYSPIGGVFLLTPAKTKLTKKATVQITYTDSGLLNLGAANRESALTLAYWNGTDWTPINSVLDDKNNTVTADITQFYSDGMAIVVPQAASSTNANTNSVAQPATIVPSHDTDNDGLTDQEELLYGTNPSDPDTDHDSYRDGQEVISHYNPNGKNKLIDSGLVKTYQNMTYRYSILYPSSWTVGALNADKLVLFTSITGEFVQVSVQDNAGGLSAREWYQSLNPSVGASSLKDVAVGTLNGIIGPDNLNIYLADKAYIYQITYNIGIKTEANYLSTFTMMYTSFLANIAVTKPVNVSTNTNTSSNTNSTNGNTNTNTANSGNSNANSNKNINGTGNVTIQNTNG